MYQERGVHAEPCFSFEMFRQIAKPGNPAAVHSATVSGDICKVATAPDVLDAFLLQIVPSKD